MKCISPEVYERNILLTRKKSPAGIAVKFYHLVKNLNTNQFNVEECNIFLINLDDLPTGIGFREVALPQSLVWLNDMLTWRGVISKHKAEFKLEKKFISELKTEVRKCLTLDDAKKLIKEIKKVQHPRVFKRVEKAILSYFDHEKTELMQS